MILFCCECVEMILKNILTTGNVQRIANHRIIERYRRNIFLHKHILRHQIDIGCLVDAIRLEVRGLRIQLMIQNKQRSKLIITPAIDRFDRIRILFPAVNLVHERLTAIPFRSSKVDRISIHAHVRNIKERLRNSLQLQWIQFHQK